mmetsp:Transcript_11261/g.42165  ORF Transcript_11261/g.42165 Transcript_11261/m.42165 type:complete len:1524 (-) Transcript_11261:2260-6831(-)|eukprot:CAMPEP_0117446092 /NCGR_PEP_ID=MMETSP0759-20121206/6147_1 /TAXON_ID=63605 /ORGANISM="Percolomonas cosmopolitus, Strain WS" /LENGTH=1523 /DNA_ID=CAMNT_0005238317 /DNA_START=438 /DNA_END=5009 /DNA_ORIENTATION=+
MNQKTKTKILDNNLPPHKRFKYILTFTESSTTDDEDIRQFYGSNFSLVYKIFLDTMHYLDGTAKMKKGNKNISTSETVGLSKLILALFRYNREIIKKKWQQRSIVQYIEIYLEQGNVFAIRKAGFEMLLGFLDILQEEADPKLYDLLLNSVDFSKHLKESDGIELPNFEVRNLSSTEKFRLQKATYSLTEDESLQLLSLLFDQINMGNDSFSFWWDFFKRNLAPILYPIACKNLSLIDVNVMVGFARCPPKLHSIVVDSFLLFLKDEQKRALLYSTHENLKLLMSIFRDSFIVLVPEKYNVLDDILNVYYSWVEDKPQAEPSHSDSVSEITLIERPKLLDEQIDGYYSSIIETFTLTFSLAGSSTSTDIHIKMSFEVLQHLHEFPLEKINPDTTRELHKSLIEVFQQLMRRKRSDNKYDMEYASMIERLTFRYLMVFWIQTHPGDEYEDTWELFNQMMQEYFEEEVVFEFWRIVLLAFANEIIVHLFQLPSTLLPPAQSLNAEKFDVQMRGKRIKVTAVSSQHQLSDDLRRLELDTILYLWHRFLWMYGVEKEKNKVHANLHLKQISVIAELVNRFLKISHSQVKVAKGTKQPAFVHSPEGTTLYDLFMDRLVEACLRSSDDFTDGRCVAYTTLCKMFCEQYAQSFSQQSLARFYSVMHAGLISRSIPIMRSIIMNSWNLFSFGYKGSLMLLPYYVQACEYVLFNASSSEDLKLTAIRCLSSVIAMCYYFDDATIPQMERIEDEDRLATYYNFVGIRRKICQICIPTAEDRKYDRCQIRAIWGLFMITYKTLTTDDELDVSVVIETLLNIIFDEKESVAFAAHDFFTSLAHLHLVRHLELEVISLIIRRFCIGIKQNLCQPFISYFGTPQSRARTVTHLLYTFVELIVEVPALLLQIPNVSEPLFDTITLAIDICDHFKQSDQSSSASRRKTMVQPLKDSAPQHATAIEEAEQIKIAAEVLLNFILNSVNNFPTPSSASQMSSSFTEFSVLKERDGNYEPSPKVQHFIFNNYTILTVMESPADKETARIIIRDMTGRYCWDQKLILNNSNMTLIGSKIMQQLKSNGVTPGADGGKATTPEPVPQVTGDTETQSSSGGTNKRDSVSSQALDTSFRDTDVTETPSSPVTPPTPSQTQAPEKLNSHIQEGDPHFGSMLESYEEIKYPHYHPNIDTDTTDMLEILQTYITEVFPECRYFSLPAYKPIDEQNIDNEPITKKMRERQSDDEALLQNASHRKFEAAKQPAQLESPDHVTFVAFRRFLSNVGLLNPDVRPRFTRLVNDNRFYLSLSHLDKLSERESIKVGVVYVKNQQEKQTEILKNDSASDLFNEFCLSLGWEVDLKTHTGFIGKLSTDGTTGDTIPYFSNATTEVVFHVVPWMPTKEDDSVQLIKKRHVGNDFVHIIWSEHDRAYRPWTLPSQFNFVHIIIYPLTDLLYRIQIFSKDKCAGTVIPDIGPLQDGMVVDKFSLGPLVRQTSVNANKACRYNQSGYKKPFLTRRDLVNEIIDKSKPRNSGPTDFYADLLRVE